MNELLPSRVRAGLAPPGFAQALISCLEVRIFRGRCPSQLAMIPSTLKPQPGEQGRCCCGCRGRTSPLRLRAAPGFKGCLKVGFPSPQLLDCPELSFGTARRGQTGTERQRRSIQDPNGPGKALGQPSYQGCPWGARSPSIPAPFSLTPQLSPARWQKRTGSPSSPRFFSYSFLFECKELKMHNLDWLGFL